MSTNDDDKPRSAIDASHHHDFVEANRAYFDTRANATGTDEAHHESPELARREVRAMVRAWPELFDEEHTEALDYACGTGAFSRIPVCPLADLGVVQGWSRSSCAHT